MHRYIKKLDKPPGGVSDSEWHRIEVQFYQMIWEYCVLDDIQQYRKRGEDSLGFPDTIFLRVQSLNCFARTTMNKSLLMIGAAL